MPRPARRRLLSAGLLAATIITGLAVHRWAPDTAASDIAGDALYALAAYLGLAMLVPEARPRVLGLVAAAWCTAVELLQLTGLPERLGTTFPPAMLLLGTVFDVRDLLVYLLMVALAMAVDAALLAASGRQQPRRAPSG
ncbi:ribosomal maturation YjgA family protein [Microbacterium sp. zg.Y909]|uniref:ribosomal maturation YjgA family protein n=1 Tax=Microbacterium sp. zg.Y909 TaxID=2969413 RepID=UPI00214D0842|nr:DUF2809 domain-containing protein [Microbacterium sp. zg.Y909]MCR2825909.1 DUF2809 domain-containing protein [Microbacterium sp. zg.Y909]